MSRLFGRRQVAAAALLVPLFWGVGHLALLLPDPMTILRGDVQQDELYWMALIYAGMLASALITGLVIAFFARAVGFGAIRSLLTPSRAEQFGLLTVAIFWVALTGLNWAYFLKDETLIAVWYVIVGAANGLFGVVWLVLAARAAASLHKFRAALVLFGSAAGSVFAAIGLYIVAILFLTGPEPQPSLVLYGLMSLLLVGLYVIPPALATAGSAAFWGGVLGLTDRGRRGADEKGSPEPE